MRVRAGCLVGLISRDLGRLKRSERLFSILYRLSDGCPCCQPAIDRHSSLLLSTQKNHPEAIERAEKAMAAKGSESNIYSMTLATVYNNAGDHRAAKYYIEGLATNALGTPLYRVALFNLASALTFCEDMAEKARNIERVESMLPDLRQAYKDIRGVSVERAYLKWLDGGIYATKAETLKGRKCRKARCNARDSLTSAYKHFHRLGLEGPALAAWSDLLAIVSQIDIAKVPDTCETLEYPRAFEDIASSVIQLAKSFSIDARAKLLRVLKTLRDSCEGAPLFSYE
jgi:hypothetical protein